MFSFKTSDGKILECDVACDVACDAASILAYTCHSLDKAAGISFSFFRQENQLGTYGIQEMEKNAATTARL